MQAIPLDSRRYWVISAIVIVVSMAAFLRLDGITNVGIRFDDEGAYAGDARLWHRCARVLTDPQTIGAIARGDKATIQRRMEAHGVDFEARYDKPSQGFTFLGSAVMFAVGDRPAALLVLNAVTGTLSVLVLFGIGAILFGPAVGLCAALFLAMSPYHLFYCRTALTEATAGFFVLCGVWVWLLGVQRNWSRSRVFGFTGILLGFAITCHYRCLFVPGIILLLDWLRSRAQQPDVRGTSRLRSAIHGWAWLAVGAAFPAILIEGMFLTVRTAAWLSNSYLPVATYFQASWQWFQLALDASRIDMARDAVSPVRNVISYGGYYLRWQGIAMAVLTVLGMCIMLRRRGVEKTPVLVALITLLFLVNQPYPVARALSVAVPFLCVCSAVGLFWVLKIFPPRPAAKLVATFTALSICLFVPAREVARVRESRSSVSQASAFLATKGPTTTVVGVDTYHRSKYWLYLDGSDTIVRNDRLDKLGTAEQVAAQLRNEGVRWVIIDPQRWHFRDTPPGPRNGVFDWWESMSDYLSREAILAAEFPHMIDSCWEFLADGPGLISLDEMQEQRSGTIRVYDLGEQAISPQLSAASSKTSIATVSR